MSGKTILFSTAALYVVIGAAGALGAEDMAPKSLVLVSIAGCCPDSTWLALERRLERELALSGVTLDRFEASERDIPSEILPRLIVEKGAIGGIAVSVDEERRVILSLSFRDPGANRVLHRRVVLSVTPEAEAEAVALAAIEAEEAVLAMLYETRRTSAPPHPESARLEAPVSVSGGVAAADARSPRPPPRRRLRLEAMAVGAWSPGGLGPMVQTGGGGSWQLGPWVIGAAGTVSVFSKDIETQAASASVRLVTAYVAAALAPKRFGLLQPLLGVRAGICHVRTDGASDTLAVRTDRATLLYGALFAEAAVVLSQTVEVPFTLGAGAILPGLAVRFSGAREAALGIWRLDASVGVRVSLGLSKLS